MIVKIIGKSNIYSKYINKYYKNIEVFEFITSLFVLKFENYNQNLEDTVYNALKSIKTLTLFYF